ncbi:MAG TPA: zinc ribbon domain-containing protein [Solirubrobacteraceae bacterium]|nr:zinc ribbon domain-containing protein [Solirubrobacteraceae bacterium]
MALTKCEHCGSEVPASRFCIRCGHELEGGETALSQFSRVPGASAVGRGLSGVLSIDPSSLSGVRRAFAAAPHESVLRPTIVSTIFPQLPRPSMAAFRTCLGLGLASVLVLGLAGLYPVALIAGAVLLPVLVVLYMVDVNVFEEQSLPVIGGTLLWGLAAGAVTAVIAKSLSPSGSDVFVGDHSSLVLTRGILIPLLSMVLILAGPLAMLRYPRFATVLDGATFGAASASAFVAAEVIVQALSVLGHGLRPPGSVGPWLVQLAIIAIALPLVTMASMAASAGVVWLRVRAPIRDRSALGRLGSLYLALPVGAAFLVVSAVVQITLPSGVALAIIAVLAVLALLWLRQVIHLGLLEEALLIEDAPIITCANCGHRTRRGTFCENCGIALAALPASRSSLHRSPTSSSSTTTQ